MQRAANSYHFDADDFAERLRRKSMAAATAAAAEEVRSAAAAAAEAENILHEAEVAAAHAEAVLSAIPITSPRRASLAGVVERRGTVTWSPAVGGTAQEATVYHLEALLSATRAAELAAVAFLHANTRTQCLRTLHA